MKQSALIILALLLAATAWRCTSPLSGGSSDHGNGRCATVFGTLKQENGDPATDTRVLLLPDTFNFAVDSTIPQALTTHTDSLGNFTFDSIPFGRYCLSGKDSWSGCMLANKISRVETDSVDAGNLSLTRPGTVYFNIDSFNIAPGLILYYPGLPLTKKIDSSAVQWINGVPSGIVKLNGYDPGTGTSIDLGIEYLLVELAPGQEVFLLRRTTPWCIIDDSTTANKLDGTVGTLYTFSAIDPALRGKSPYRYRFSWGIKEAVSPWSEDCLAQYAWNEPGIYFVQSQAMSNATCSAFSDPITVIIREKKQ